MNVSQVKACCAALPGGEASMHGAPANILSYKVKGKKYAYFKTSAPEKWRFSIRVTPQWFLELTDQPGIKPARFMGRFHWVTIVEVAEIDEAYLRQLIQYSYDKAVSGLSKKLQNEIV